MSWLDYVEKLHDYVSPYLQPAEDFISDAFSGVGQMLQNAGAEAGIDSGAAVARVAADQVSSSARRLLGERTSETMSRVINGDVSNTGPMRWIRSVIRDYTTVWVLQDEQSRVGDHPLVMLGVDSVKIVPGPRLTHIVNGLPFQAEKIWELRTLRTALYAAPVQRGSTQVNRHPQWILPFIYHVTGGSIPQPAADLLLMVENWAPVPSGSIRRRDTLAVLRGMAQMSLSPYCALMPPVLGFVDSLRDVPIARAEVLEHVPVRLDALNDMAEDAQGLSNDKKKTVFARAMMPTIDDQLSVMLKSHPDEYIVRMSPSIPTAFEFISWRTADDSVSIIRTHGFHDDYLDSTKHGRWGPRHANPFGTRLYHQAIQKWMETDGTKPPDFPDDDDEVYGSEFSRFHVEWPKEVYEPFYKRARRMNWFNRRNVAHHISGELSISAWLQTVLQRFDPNGRLALCWNLKAAFLHRIHGAPGLAPGTHPRRLRMFRTVYLRTLRTLWDAEQKDRIDLFSARNEPVYAGTDYQRQLKLWDVLKRASTTLNHYGDIVFTSLERRSDSIWKRGARAPRRTEDPAADLGYGPGSMTQTLKFRLERIRDTFLYGTFYPFAVPLGTPVPANLPSPWTVTVPSPPITDASIHPEDRNMIWHMHRWLGVKWDHQIFRGPPTNTTVFGNDQDTARLTTLLTWMLHSVFCFPFMSDRHADSMLVDVMHTEIIRRGDFRGTPCVVRLGESGASLDIRYVAMDDDKKNIQIRGRSVSFAQWSAWLADIPPNRVRSGAIIPSGLFLLTGLYSTYGLTPITSNRMRNTLLRKRHLAVKNTAFKSSLDNGSTALENALRELDHGLTVINATKQIGPASAGGSRQQFLDALASLNRAADAMPLQVSDCGASLYPVVERDGSGKVAINCRDHRESDWMVRGSTASQMSAVSLPRWARADVTGFWAAAEASWKGVYSNMSDLCQWRVNGYALGEHLTRWLLLWLGHDGLRCMASDGDSFKCHSNSWLSWAALEEILDDPGILAFVSPATADYLASVHLNRVFISLSQGRPRHIRVTFREQSKSLMTEPVVHEVHLDDVFSGVPRSAGDANVKVSQFPLPAGLIIRAYVARKYGLRTSYLPTIVMDVAANQVRVVDQSGNSHSHVIGSKFDHKKTLVASGAMRAMAKYKETVIRYADYAGRFSTPDSVNLIGEVMINYIVPDPERRTILLRDSERTVDAQERRAVGESLRIIHELQQRAIAFSLDQPVSNEESLSNVISQMAGIDELILRAIPAILANDPLMNEYRNRFIEMGLTRTARTMTLGMALYRAGMVKRASDEFQAQRALGRSLNQLESDMLRQLTLDPNAVGTLEDVEREASRGEKPGLLARVFAPRDYYRTPPSGVPMVIVGSGPAGLYKNEDAIAYDRSGNLAAGVGMEGWIQAPPPTQAYPFGSPGSSPFKAMNLVQSLLVRLRWLPDKGRILRSFSSDWKKVAWLWRWLGYETVNTDDIERGYRFIFLTEVLGAWMLDPFVSRTDVGQVALERRTRAFMTLDWSKPGGIVWIYVNGEGANERVVTDAYDLDNMYEKDGKQLPHFPALVRLWCFNHCHGRLVADVRPPGAKSRERRPPLDNTRTVLYFLDTERQLIHTIRDIEQQSKNDIESAEKALRLFKAVGTGVTDVRQVRRAKQRAAALVCLTKPHVSVSYLRELYSDMIGTKEDAARMTAADLCMALQSTDRTVNVTVQQVPAGELANVPRDLVRDDGLIDFETTDQRKKDTIQKWLLFNYGIGPENLSNDAQVPVPETGESDVIELPLTGTLVDGIKNLFSKMRLINNPGHRKSRSDIIFMKACESYFDWFSVFSKMPRSGTRQKGVSLYEFVTSGLWQNRFTQFRQAATQTAIEKGLVDVMKTSIGDTKNTASDRTVVSGWNHMRSAPALKGLNPEIKLLLLMYVAIAIEDRVGSSQT